MPIALNFDPERFPSHCAGKKHWIEWLNAEVPSQIHLVLEYGGPLVPGGPVESWDTMKVAVGASTFEAWGAENGQEALVAAVQWIEANGPTTDELLSHVEMTNLEGFWFPRINMDVEVPE